MKTCDVCGDPIEFQQYAGWVHASGPNAGHRGIPVDDECEHGVEVKDFGDCQECVRSLQGDLDEWERTPEGAAARERYDNAVQNILRRGRS